ncbi:MAG: hypothetical protein P8Q37_07145 [Porticoccaceae bacterium]|nr:hypothetical protein [Porticoccaceae bacterium]MDG1474664.1 hypothetical protein [Porticoccaceae bacterium]
MIDQLIGIYNAKGSFAGELAYLFGKLKGTAQCALCDISHGPLKEKSAFVAASAQLPVPFIKLHLDELNLQLSLFKDQAPCVIAISEGNALLLIDDLELRACAGNVDHFFTLVKTKLALY